MKLKKNLVLIGLVFYSLGYSQSLDKAIQYVEIEQFGNAEKEFKSLISTDAENVAYLNAYAEMLTENGRLKEALELIEKSLKIDSKKNGIAFAVKGAILSEKGEESASKEAFNQGFEISKGKKAQILKQLNHILLL